MKRRIIYIAEDGKEFDNLNACAEYETEITDTTKIKKALNILEGICVVHDCTNCILNYDNRCIFSDLQAARAISELKNE